MWPVRRLVLLCCPLAGVLLCAPPAAPSPSPARLSFAAIPVRLARAFGSSAAATNANGNYYIDRDLPAGTYSVKASKSGYSPLTKTGMVVAAGATTWVYFALQP